MEQPRYPDSRFATSALELVPSGVVHLDEQQAVFDAMLSGWANRQRSRLLQEATIRQRLQMVSRFTRFCGEYPWRWGPGDLEAWTAHRMSGDRPLTHSTIRGYHNGLRLFCSYLVDDRYGWTDLCAQRFGSTPTQIVHDWNSAQHVAEFEARPEVRSFDHEELQMLFDEADARVRRISQSGRKGSLAAFRDAAMFKVAYAFGLRRRELLMLDIADLRPNPEIHSFGRYGAVWVRYGKALKGSPPRRRSVLLVPQFGWAADVLRQYISEVRPRFAPGQHQALWVTERRGRVSPQLFNKSFRESPRDWWRLRLLRGWSHDRATTTGQVPGGDAPTCGADGA